MESILHFLYEIYGVNRAAYPPIQVFFLALGFVFWAMAYKEVIWGIRKYKIVEIPMAVCAMDISWEFDWGFLLENDFGRIFKIGSCFFIFKTHFSKSCKPISDENHELSLGLKRNPILLFCKSSILHHSFFVSSDDLKK